MGLFQNIGRTLFGGRKKQTTHAAVEAKVAPAKTRQQVIAELTGRRPHFLRGKMNHRMTFGNKKAVQLKLAHCITGYTVPVKKSGKHRSQEIQRRRNQFNNSRPK